MKFAIFTVLLFISSSYAADLERGSNRIVDIILKDWLNKLVDEIIRRGLDPRETARREINLNLIDGLVGANGVIEGFRLEGPSQIDIKKLYYNILWNMLEFDVRFTRVFVSIDNADITARYGDTVLAGTGRGSIELLNVGVAGTARMWHDSTGDAHIQYINPEFKADGINSNVNIVGSRDYSDDVNNFLNEGIFQAYDKYRQEVNILLGDAIIYAVNWIKGRN